MKARLTPFFLILLTTSTLFAQEQKPPALYVFIGKKIAVTQFEPAQEKGQLLMDLDFKAKYKIIQHLYGAYSKDTIEFEAYDHYGFPAFAVYEHVLMYVSEEKGKLYHEKYQYDGIPP